ncbi:MAG: hypothetical protein HY532_02920 [Chloroflexi bacterium]|nr:hypothetical protein [Chloroflexota bacterium]
MKGGHRGTTLTISRKEEVHPDDYRRVRELCDRYADAGVGLVNAAAFARTKRLNEPKLLPWTTTTFASSCLAMWMCCGLFPKSSRDQ